MATYYVSSGSGADSNNGTSYATAKKTIAGAIAVATTTRDVIEIIDENTYYEDDLDLAGDRMIVAHTASHLGRPRISGLYSTIGTGSAFELPVASTRATFIGLEISDFTGNPVSSSVFNVANMSVARLHLSGCFIHDVTSLTSGTLSGSPGDPTTIDECVMFFSNSGGYGVSSLGNTHIKNCLITSSVPDGFELFTSFSSSYPNVTASFCTFMARSTAVSSYPIVKAGQVVNCIAAASGGIRYGIASDSHSYNLVYSSDTMQPFRNMAHDTNADPGKGDIINKAPQFIDSGTIGNGPEVAANFKLQSTSPCINAGTDLGGVVTDISGNARPVKVWGPYSTAPSSSFANDFTLNLYGNESSQHRKVLCNNDIGAYEYQDPEAIEGPICNVEQVPFLTGQKGMSTLRGRSTAYILSMGSELSALIQSGSG